jgi:DNA-binding LacI/PurR family transcriptional regulator
LADRAPIAPLSRHLLYESVAEGIRRLVAESGLWGSYLPPERELAEIFGVNRGTVRKGLATLEKQGLVARRQGQGTRVLPRAGETNGRKVRRIAVASFVKLPGSSFHAGIMNGVAMGASDADWNVTFHAGLGRIDRWEKLISCLDENNLDGLLIVSITQRKAMQELLGRWKGPAVLVDHYFEDLAVTGVIDNSRVGARRATEHLLALGHRRIGYVDVSDPESNPWRGQGYEEALLAADVIPRNELRVGCHGSVREGRETAEQLLELPEPPTAILAFDDTRAWGVWEAVEARGMEVGRDFAIVGYGDTPPPNGRAVEMTTVHINPRAMGEVGVRELDKLIESKGTPGQLITLPAELVIRKSSREARGNIR